MPMLSLASTRLEESRVRPRCAMSSGGPARVPGVRNGKIHLKPPHHTSGTFSRVRPGRMRLVRPRMTGWGSCTCRRSSAPCMTREISA